MAGEQLMTYVGFCRICGTGPLGLRSCGNCGTVVVLCDECDAVWADAELEKAPRYAKEGELNCAGCEASLVEPPSHWAREEDLRGVEWLQEAIAAGKLELKQGAAMKPDVEKTDLPDDVGG